MAIRRASSPCIAPMLSQHVSVSFPFTVEEVAHMGAGDRGRAAAEPLVEAALHEAGLADFPPYANLPTAFRRRAAARAFARVLGAARLRRGRARTGLLLLDEPTSSLDLRHQIDLVETARRRAANGTAVVAILHDLNLAVRFADRIVVLHRGAKVADDVPARTVTDGLYPNGVRDRVRVQRHPDGTPLVLPQLMTAMRSLSADGRSHRT